MLTKVVPIFKRIRHIHPLERRYQPPAGPPFKFQVHTHLSKYAVSVRRLQFVVYGLASYSGTALMRRACAFFDDH
jgi:hypothetical protein